MSGYNFSMMKIKWPRFSKTYKHTCPDGNVVIIYKDINDAFPLHIEGFEAKVGGNFATMGESASMKAEYATLVQGLMYSLNELNQSIMINFRSVYLAYQSNPCNDNGFFKRQVEKIVDEQHQLTRLNIQVQGLMTLAENDPDNRDNIILIYQQIVHQLGGTTVPTATSLEITENREYAQSWVGGQHGR